MFSADVAILRTYAVDLRYRTTLPPGAPNVTIASRALDQIGGTSAVARSVRVTASTLAGGALTSVASSAFADAFALDSLDSICSIVTAATPAAKNESITLELLVSMLSDAVAMYLDADTTLVEQATSTLAGPVAYTATLTLDAAILALDLVDSLSSSLLSAGIGDGESTSAGSIAAVVSDLLDKPELFGLDESVYAEARRRRGRRRLLGRLLTADSWANSTNTENSSANATNATSDSTSEIVIRTIDQLAAAQLDTLIIGEAAVGVNSPNYASSNQRVSSAGGAASLSQPYMNSSANFTPAAGVLYAAQLSEIPLQVSPYAASDDYGAAIATAAIVRFGTLQAPRRNLALNTPPPYPCPPHDSISISSRTWGARKDIIPDARARWWQDSAHRRPTSGDAGGFRADSTTRSQTSPPSRHCASPWVSPSRASTLPQRS